MRESIDCKAAHQHSSHHRDEVMGSVVCGCFYCLSQFLPGAIETWTDLGTCAICPHCGIDAVIGSASGYPIEKAFLQQMHQIWFEE